MEVSIFNNFQTLISIMYQRFIELDDICHINKQASRVGVFDDPLWRESYYFNMTDQGSGISLITTIGLLPNKERITGCIFLFKDGKTIFIKPLIQNRKPVFNDSSFELKRLKYSITGTNWKVEYRNGTDMIDLLFTPINKVYPYIVGRSDDVFERIGSQHLEQSGIFEGTIKIKGGEISIGPCFGHRDHSWGIRDWAAVDKYKLFCCAFSNNFAINLWTGILGRKEFLKGYVFDGARNSKIVECNVQSLYDEGGLEPREAVIHIKDEKRREFQISCVVVASIPIPFKRSIMYETIAWMQVDGKVGYGLLEYLYRIENPFQIIIESRKLLKHLFRVYS